MTSTKTILVTGATGNLGGAVVNALLAKGMTVKAGTTRPEGAKLPAAARTVRIVYEDMDSVSAALEGLDGLFLVAPPLDQAAPAKLNPVIDRAKTSGIKHIVFNSALGVDQNEAAPLRLIERYLMASGVGYTILRPNFFMENFSTGFLAPMIAQGGIYLAAGEGRTSFISIEDIAAVTASVFEEERLEAAYDLTGPAALDHAQVAAILSEVSGRTIHYHGIEEAAMCQGVRDQGMPEDAVEYLALLYQAVRKGWAARVTTDVATITGRSPISFRAFAQRQSAVWK